MMKGRDLVFHFSFQISSCIKENMFLSHRCRGEEWVTSWCPLFDKSSPLAAYSVLWGTSFNLSFIEWICVLEPAELHLKAWFQLEILRGEQSKEQHTAHWVSGELRPGLSHQCNCLYHHPWHLRFPNTFTFTHSFDLYKNLSVWYSGPEYLLQFYWWEKEGLRRWSEWRDMRARSEVYWLNIIHVKFLTQS